MIESFVDINGSTKAEEVRAWCVQAAIEKYGDTPTDRRSIVALATAIEDYVLNGRLEIDEGDTLDKVVGALTLDDGGLVMSVEDAQELIRKMQNAGILFRTRSAT